MKNNCKKMITKIIIKTLKNMTLRVLTMSLMLLLMLSATTFAANNISITLNGKEVKLNTDAILMNNRTMIPLRSVLEELGAIVSWDNKIKEATAITDEYKIKIRLNSNEIERTNIKTGKVEKIKIDQPAIVKNNRTLVPVRFVSESIGSKVGWDKNTKTVVIADTKKIKKDYKNKLSNYLEIAKYNVNAGETLEYKNTTEVTLVGINGGKVTKDKESLKLQIDTTTFIQKNEAVEVTVNVKGDIEQILNIILGEKVIMRNRGINSAKFVLYLDKEKAKFDTDLINNLIKLMATEEVNKLKATGFDKDMFNNGIYIYYKDLIGNDGLKSEEVSKNLDKILNNLNVSNDNFDIAIEDLINNIDINDASTTLEISLIMDTLKTIFDEKYFTKEQGKITYRVNKSNLIEIVNECKKLLDTYGLNENFLNDSMVEKIKSFDVNLIKDFNAEFETNYDDNGFKFGKTKLNICKAFNTYGNEFEFELLMKTDSEIKAIKKNIKRNSVEGNNISEILKSVASMFLLTKKN